ncbi:MAG: type II secretion system F family protein [Elusimicrobia bacterium]|nr:type II secretion system F family protein [Elusimicrobiota bacterium]
MSAGQILFYILMMAVFVVTMAFQNKCFSPLCLISYLCLSGGMLAVYSFVESLLGFVLAPKTQDQDQLSVMRERQIFARPQGGAWLDSFNSSILSNPWIGQILERDYYGLGQPKYAEPAALLTTMEKYGFWGAVATAGFCLWAGIGINPGLVMAGFVIAFFLPHLNAQQEVGKRRRKALMNLPSFVDLLALTVESGLDYMSSMERILATTYKKRGPLEQEIDHVLKQIQLGFPRRDALRNMARRVDVQEIRSLVGLLIQSEELGTGLVRLLRNFSQDMRNRRVSKAEELAGKASTKMLGPLMIFIFPVIFALILSPFAVAVFKGGAGLSF